MIYFKEKHLLRSFIDKELLDHDKSEFNFLHKEKQRLFMKYSNVPFTNEDEFIDELQKYGYVYEFKHGIRDFLSVIIKEAGFIFLFSKYKSDMKQQDVSSNPIRNERLLTINQVSDFLSVSRTTVYNKIKEGVIPVVNLFGHKRVQFSDILDYIERNKSK